jgi:branched-subunit amino acid aminotransferase/4-amino-4-deoxychorismate lyase
MGTATGSWIGYWNGRFLPDDEVRISPSDRGFVLGDAVYEITRTYRHVPFHLDWHLDRLFAGLQYIELDPLLTRNEIETLTLDVLDRNRARLRPDDDVILTQRITRGPNPPLFGGPPPGPPTVLITCRPIHFPLFAHLYTTNVFVVIRDELVTPPDGSALEGITRRVVIDLAGQAGLNVARRPLNLSELHHVSEAFVTGTGSGPIPVRVLDGRSLRPVPGAITGLLTQAFSGHVGVDIVNQGRLHAAHSGANSR